MSRAAIDVARRCLCLELLAQRLVLESGDDPASEREAARAAWVKRIADLAIEPSDDERALLERPVGSLGEDDLDELDGRAPGAAVLLWTLGRIAERPTFASADDAIADHGLLGDGSIAKARAAAEGASLRSQDQIEEARRVYAQRRGRAREPADPEQIYAGIAAHHLTWVSDPAMDFDDDLTLA